VDVCSLYHRPGVWVCVHCTIHQVCGCVYHRPGALVCVHATKDRCVGVNVMSLMTKALRHVMLECKVYHEGANIILALQGAGS